MDFQTKLFNAFGVSIMITYLRWFKWCYIYFEWPPFEGIWYENAKVLDNASAWYLLSIMFPNGISSCGGVMMVEKGFDWKDASNALHYFGMWLQTHTSRQCGDCRVAELCGWGMIYYSHLNNFTAMCIFGYVILFHDFINSDFIILYAC